MSYKGMLHQCCFEIRQYVSAETCRRSINVPSPPHLQVEGVDVAKLEQRLAEGEEAETAARGRQS